MANRKYFYLERTIMIVIILIIITIADTISYGSSTIIDSTQDFKKLIASNVFVDKSEFIVDFLISRYTVHLITMPKGFGKSINTGMLKTFVEIEVDEYGNKSYKGHNEQCFKNLKVAKTTTDIYYDFQGKYPVIFLSFSDVKGSTYQELVQGIQSSVKKAFFQHRYLLHVNSIRENDKIYIKKFFTPNELNTVETEYGLYKLNLYLVNHFEKESFIIVDDYDKPIQEAYFHSNCTNLEKKKILNTIVNLFLQVFYQNRHLKRGLISGVTQIPKSGFYSGFNNYITHTVLQTEFTSDFGFTEEEVTDLLERLGKSDLKNNIKRRYGGYYFQNNKRELYNPWSVIQYLQKNENDKLDGSNWTLDNGLILLIKSFNAHTEIMNVLDLVKNFSVNANISELVVLGETDNNSFYSIAVHFGYLNADKVKHQVRIPNMESHNIFSQLLRDWIIRRIDISDEEIGKIGDLIVEILRGKDSAILTGKLDTFFVKLYDRIKIKDFQMPHDTHSAEKNATKEIWYDLSMFLFILSSKYRNNFEIFAKKIIDNKTELNITADLVLIPLDGKGVQAYILRYKFIESTENAYKFEVCSVPLKFENKVMKQTNDETETIFKKFPYIKKIINATVSFCSKFENR